ncbi:unnamed protein product [Paramecium primaurelia]|uniref:Uncharacterized protein n=1 Tax=Paramecium primaurelia TaxID=5886 RepID=A0A8S1LI98_PARPR|nr:unnamed protein product [Paramecium primaurelia]
MQRFNKYIRSLREEIVEDKLSQKQYRLLKFQKLIGIIIISTFGITSLAFYNLSGKIEKQKQESFDDSNNEDVLQEAKLLLNRTQQQSSIKK